MSEQPDASLARRRLLKLIGTSAALLPVVGLSGCTGGKDSAAPAATKSDPAPKAPEPEMKTEMDAETKADSPPADQPAASGGMARLSEDDPQAKSLSYVHDATQLDKSKQPRYQAGQACDNCALYQAADGAEWGGCSIFPGRQVKATGWCSVYAPKAG